MIDTLAAVWDVVASVAYYATYAVLYGLCAIMMAVAVTMVALFAANAVAELRGQ